MKKSQTQQPPKEKRKQTKPFNIDDYVSWTLPREEVVEIKQAFDIFDNDGSGIMDPA